MSGEKYIVWYSPSKWLFLSKFLAPLCDFIIQWWKPLKNLIQNGWKSLSNLLYGQTAMKYQFPSKKNYLIYIIFLQFLQISNSSCKLIFQRESLEDFRFKWNKKFQILAFFFAEEEILDLFYLFDNGFFEFSGGFWDSVKLKLGRLSFKMIDCGGFKEFFC
jgi:hypothetical protein